MTDEFKFIELAKSRTPQRRKHGDDSRKNHMTGISVLSPCGGRLIWKDFGIKGLNWNLRILALSVISLKSYALSWDGVLL